MRVQSKRWRRWGGWICALALWLSWSMVACEPQGKSENPGADGEVSADGGRDAGGEAPVGSDGTAEPVVEPPVQPDEPGGADTVAVDTPPPERPVPVDQTPDQPSPPDQTAPDQTPDQSTPPKGVPTAGGCQIFPKDNPWNTDISKEPVDPNSDALIASIGNDTGLHPDFGTVWQGAPIGIPYVIVPPNQKGVNVSFQYANESDPGPYPIPKDAPIEGGPNGSGDRHVLVLVQQHCKLYELFSAYPQPDGSWKAGSGAIFDLSSNKRRPDTWTSADAAGLPIFPGLVRYDEVQKGEINHALRFTVVRSRKAFVHPATHWASSRTATNLPPMGMRVRLKASFDISSYTKNVQVILRAMKKYGMFMADNGSNWYVSGAPDSRWSDDELRALKKVKGKDFEVVKMGKIYTPADFP